jgi:hypothetical protein
VTIISLAPVAATWKGRSGAKPHGDRWFEPPSSTFHPPISHAAARFKVVTIERSPCEEKEG